MRSRFWRLGGSLLLLFAAVLVPSLFVSLVRADVPPSPWLATQQPTLDKISDLSPYEVANMIKSVNSDCRPREVITRPERPIPLPPYIQTKLSTSGCVTDTAYGALSNGQYLQRQGSTVYGNILTGAGGQTTLIPIPNSSTGLVINGGNFSGSYLWFIKNLDTKLDSSAIYTGEVTHKLPLPPYTSSLHDGSGHMLTTQVDTISFSSNGDWMVVDLPGVGTARVNTQTYEVLPFGDAVNYDIGIGPAMRTAISPDGRYAVVASKNFEIFKLYDLSTCGPVPNSITAQVSCASRDLLAYVRGKVPNFSSIFRMRFRSDYTLDMYINSLQNNALVTSHYAMVAAGQLTTGFDYLALGDSFAAGEGAYQYKSITDTVTNKCHLSQRSYPYLISNYLQFGQHESVACSGAKIEDILRADDGYKGQVKDGLTRKDRRLDTLLQNLNPGYVGQIEFSEHYQPNIITISTAGNDIGFSDKIERCLDTDTCYSSYEDRLEIVNEINAQFYRLTNMYSQIKSSTDPRAKLYVIGYPQIAQVDGNCALNVHLNNAEIIFSQQLIGYLNSVVKTAAANAGAFYVDAEDAFAGHKLCETDSWNVAVNGLTNGNDIADIPFVHGPLANESFHPNAFGQELLKIKILALTHDFTTTMPAPDPNALIQDPLPSLPILQAPKTNRAIRIIKNVTGTDGGIINFGQKWIQDYSLVSPFIKAGTSVDVWLHSDPTHLGTFSVDSSGSLSLAIDLPNSVPPGFHSLHIYGKNTSGEDMDLYQTVYVATGGSTTACVMSPSGIDADKDNIDDACDPMIDQPPPITPDPLPPVVINPPILLPVDPPLEVIPLLTNPILPPTIEPTPAPASIVIGSPPASTLPQPLQPNENPQITTPPIPPAVTEIPQTLNPDIINLILPNIPPNPEAPASQPILVVVDTLPKSDNTNQFSQDTEILQTSVTNQAPEALTAKPSENNPKTEAGSGQITVLDSSLSNSTPQVLASTSQTRPPSTPITLHPSPEVASATTFATDTPAITPKPPHKTQPQWLIPALTLIALILATPIIKTRLSN